ncbi:hypothetical protein CGMCC3_g1795 [Colletotrichum fructicola]|nr:uncharacterized protein CGMCC3_g1795 [Colletotrichum fructicola]KAE9582332.1 hypothetical protein CGMCC3_g1795 [Colletotrichum fructicola]
MTFILPRGPKMIEAICPGCFKSFTKIGSMHRTDLDLHKNGGYCVAKQSQWQPQPQPFDLNYFDANWMAFDTTWGQSWPQAQPQLTNWTSTSPGCA